MPALPLSEPAKTPIASLPIVPLISTMTNLGSRNELQELETAEWLNFLHRQHVRIAMQCEECLRLRNAIVAIIVRRKKNQSTAEKAENNEKNTKKTSLQNQLVAHLRQPSHPSMLMHDYMGSAWEWSTGVQRVCHHALSDSTSVAEKSRRKSKSVASRLPPTRAARKSINEEKLDAADDEQLSSDARQHEAAEKILVSAAPIGVPLVSSRSHAQAQRIDNAQRQIKITIRVRDSAGVMTDLPEPRKPYIFIVVDPDYRLKVISAAYPFFPVNLNWNAFLADHPNVCEVLVSPEGGVKDVPIIKYNRTVNSRQKKAWQNWNPGHDAAQLTAHVRRTHGNNNLVVSRAEVIVEDMLAWTWQRAPRRNENDRVDTSAILCASPCDKVFSKKNRLFRQFSRTIYLHLSTVVRAIVDKSDSWSSIASSAELESMDVLKEVSVYPANAKKNEWKLADLRRELSDGSDFKSAPASQVDNYAESDESADDESESESAKYSADDWSAADSDAEERQVSDIDAPETQRDADRYDNIRSIAQAAALPAQSAAAVSSSSAAAPAPSSSVAASARRRQNQSSDDDDNGSDENNDNDESHSQAAAESALQPARPKRGAAIAADKKNKELVISLGRQHDIIVGTLRSSKILQTTQQREQSHLIKRPQS